MLARLALAAAALVAAGSGGCPADGEPSAELAFERILDESASGLTQPLREVIRDEERWARLWEQVYAGVTPVPPRPTVDFSRRMLIAVATGTRPTGGFDVAIRTVTLRDAALEVEIFESCPPPGASVITALTQPVEVVLLDKVSQPATFRETKAPSCR